MNTYNKSKIGPYSILPFTIFIKAQDTKIIAGLNGDIFGTVCRVDCFWVEEKRRYQGLGTKLLQELEKFAISKKCKILQLYTAEFQAREFYEKIGFTTPAILENGFMGHREYIMRKML